MCRRVKHTVSNSYFKLISMIIIIIGESFHAFVLKHCTLLIYYIRLWLIEFLTWFSPNCCFFYFYSKPLKLLSTHIKNLIGHTKLEIIIGLTILMLSLFLKHNISIDWQFTFDIAINSCCLLTQMSPCLWLLVVHKEGFILFIISSVIYMLITCRLWKTVKRYSLSPEVRNSKLHTIHLQKFSVQFSIIICVCFYLGC